MALTPSPATGRTPKNVTCGCLERMVLFRHLSCSKPEDKKRVSTTKTKSLSDDLVLGVLINSIAMVMLEGTSVGVVKQKSKKQLIYLLLMVIALPSIGLTSLRGIYRDYHCRIERHQLYIFILLLLLKQLSRWFSSPRSVSATAYKNTSKEAEHDKSVF